MTRNRELDLEDLTSCDHKPEIAITNDEGTEILHWICRCGRRCPDESESPEPKEKK
jgi:hypothetical protein